MVNGLSSQSGQCCFRTNLVVHGLRDIKPSLPMLLSDKFSGAWFTSYQVKPANAAFWQIQWCIVYGVYSQACQCCFRTNWDVHGLQNIKPSLPMLLSDKFSGALFTGYQAKLVNAGASVPHRRCLFMQNWGQSTSQNWSVHGKLRPVCLIDLSRPRKTEAKVCLTNLLCTFKTEAKLPHRHFLLMQNWGQCSSQTLFVHAKLRPKCHTDLICSSTTKANVPHRPKLSMQNWGKNAPQTLFVDAKLRPKFLTDIICSCTSNIKKHYRPYLFVHVHIQWCKGYRLSSQACQCCFRTNWDVHGLQNIKPSRPMLLSNKFNGAWFTGYQAKPANAAFGHIQWFTVYEHTSQACQCCFQTNSVMHGSQDIRASLPMLLLDKFTSALASYFVDKYDPPIVTCAT